MSRWTDEEKARLRQLSETMTWQQIGEEMGRGREPVMAMAKRLGIRRHEASGKQADTSTRFSRDSAPRYFMVSARSMGIQDLAADFIRAHDRTCVFRCKKNGEYAKDGKYWKYGRGSLVLTPQEMMDKAERKGWVYRA